MNEAFIVFIVLTFTNVDNTSILVSTDMIKCCEQLLFSNDSDTVCNVSCY